MNKYLHILILGVGALIIGVSLLNPGGWLIGLIGLILWVLLTYGGSYGLRLKANRDMGANSRTTDVRDLASMGATDEGQDE